MPEMHLKQPTFTYGAYVPFAEKKERKKKNFEKKDIRDTFIKWIMQKLLLARYGLWRF